MSLARCKRCGQPEGRKHSYALSVLPAGYPDTAAICGTVGCEEPAIIWLNQDEQKEYDTGQRVFGINTNTMKVRVTDTAA